MKILLVAPVKDDSAGLAQFPPIGLGYLATALRDAGHKDVRILDCILESMDFKGFEDYLRQWRPDVVGVNSWSLSVREVKMSLEIAKSVDDGTVTVIGGPHPSALGPGALKALPEADFAFRGEAEAGLPMLMDLVAGAPGASPGKIPGLMYRRGTEIEANGQVFEEDLDSIGAPSWDMIRPERYALAGSLVRRHTACIITTRGCPFPCTFCSAHLTAGRKIRTRSPENVMEEIKLLHYCHGIKRFVVFDENITLKRDHITALCKRVISEDLDITFELPNGIRLDTLDMEILTLMRRAGFSERVAVGIESGSPRILKLMKKGLAKDEIRDKVDLLNMAGFRPIGYFIMGFPTETREEMEETIRFARELKLFRAGFMPFHPLPGTESYNLLVERGEIAGDFDFSALATDNIAYAPEGMGKDELERMRKRAILSFNLRPRVIWDYARDYNSFRFALKKVRSVFLRKTATGKSTPITGTA